MSRNDDAYCDCYDLADPPDRPEPDRPEAEDAEPRQYRHPYPATCTRATTSTSGK
jgi:hypothetical protein